MQKKLPFINSAHGSETRNIINELIKLFNGMGYTYDEALQKAHDTLKEAKQTNDMNKDVQKQVDELILHAGESDAEVIQARGGLPLLKDRLDKTDSQMAQTELDIIESKSTTAEVKGKDIVPLKIATFDGSNEPYHPSVLIHKNPWNGYRYWMAHSPLPFRRDPYVDRWECTSIEVSHDGIEWFTPPGLTNPLVDLTPQQITDRGYQSDPDLFMDGDTMVVSYRVTNGLNTSDTVTVWQKSTDGVVWSTPEIIQDPKQTDKDGLGSYNLFRSQSIHKENDKYIVYSCSDTGMFKTESTAPLNGWETPTPLVLEGWLNSNPWHAQVKPNGYGAYHLLAYFHSGHVVHFYSVDGVRFVFRKVLISVAERNHGNLLGLYQSAFAMDGNKYCVYVSVRLATNSSNFARREKRGLLLMKGDSLSSLAVIDGKHEQDSRMYRGDVVLSNSDKINAMPSQLVLSKDDHGVVKSGIGVKFVGGKPVPIINHDAGNNHIVGAYLRGGIPNSWRYHGELHINTLSDEVYIAMKNENWKKVLLEGSIEKAQAVRLDVDLSSTINITSTARRVVINSAASGLVPIEVITGGIDGQEIVLLNSLSASDIQIKHASGSSGRIRTKQKVDYTLSVVTAIKLHNINGIWYEV